MMDGFIIGELDTFFIIINLKIWIIGIVLWSGFDGFLPLYREFRLELLNSPKFGCWTSPTWAGVRIPWIWGRILEQNFGAESFTGSSEFQTSSFGKGYF